MQKATLSLCRDRTIEDETHARSTIFSGREHHRRRFAGTGIGDKLTRIPAANCILKCNLLVGPIHRDFTWRRNAPPPTPRIDCRSLGDLLRKSVSAHSMIEEPLIRRSAASLRNRATTDSDK
jgi:hypothetical protein